MLVDNFKASAPAPMLITHCLCFNQSFAELKELAGRNDCTTVKELQKHSPFGSNCKLCVPYVREMLLSGRIEFDEILND